MNHQQLTLRIVLEKPPAGVDFALQKGKGRNYEIIQKQRSGAGNLVFEFTAMAKTGGNAAAPNLLGPFAQGPPGARFVYIGIGAFAGQAGTNWSRRLKVPLTGISSDILDQIANDPRCVLETHVPGTAKDGGPNCATVRPFAGWTLVQPKRK